MNTTETTATALFDRLATDDRWLGFGYLGERRNARETGRNVDEVDAALLDHFRTAGWSDADVFAWANSKAGRWAGDVLFGSSEPLRTRMNDCRRFGLLWKQPAE